MGVPLQSFNVSESVNFSLYGLLWSCTNESKINKQKQNKTNKKQGYGVGEKLIYQASVFVIHNLSATKV